jgi:hypothetical protein
MDLDFANTELGHLQTRKKMKFIQTAHKLTQEERDTMTVDRNLTTW